MSGIRGLPGLYDASITVAGGAWVRPKEKAARRRPLEAQNFLEVRLEQGEEHQSSNNTKAHNEQDEPRIAI